MDGERRSLTTIVGGLFADVVSIFGIPAGLAQSLLAEHLSRKATVARAVLMEELRKGRINDFEAAANDEVVGAIYSYMLAARDNAARFTLRLLAKALVGQLQRERLYADEFQRWKDVLNRITPDQALVLGRFIHLTNEARRTLVDGEDLAAKARTMLKEELVPAAFRSEDHLNAVCAQAASLGLLLLRTGFGSTVYEPSPVLFELAELVDFLDAVREEAKGAAA